MEFNIYNGQIYYRGVGATLEPVLLLLIYQ